MQILKVEITNYISLSKSMSLRDTLVENERAASEPLIFRHAHEMRYFFSYYFFHSRSQNWYNQCYEKFGCRLNWCFLKTQVRTRAGIRPRRLIININFRPPRAAPASESI